jgi:hypothetical protein
MFQRGTTVELQDANPRNIWRMVDGQVTKEGLS